MLQATVALISVLASLAFGVHSFHIENEQGPFFAGHQRIYGGNRARPGQFPYQASLRLNRRRGLQHNCGGTIITNRFIVTAAHCIPPRLIDSPGEMRIVLGAHNKTDDSDGITYEVERVFVHPGWDLGLIINDIALVQTVEKIVFTDRVQRIPISRQFVNTSLRAVTSGWGKTDVSQMF